MKHKFRNDYSELAHKDILNALMNAKDEQNDTYGNDIHSLNAKNKIKELFNIPNGDVFFITGGTQANLLVISYLLKDYEAVLACDTGHINVHETGAIENTGHKVFTLKNHNGKVSAADVKEALRINTSEHMVKIKMVYISNSTETGTIYTKEELLALRKVCDENDLYLFMDGARLAIALTSSINDVEPSLLGDVCDVFYVGGTKNGLLSGEAIAFKDEKLANEFRYQIKNKGAMLAKGFVLGIQFDEAFKDGLYFKLAKNANDLAAYIKENLKGQNFTNDSYTNQLFIEFTKDVAKKVIDEYDCEIWEEKENSIVIRIVTSWATKLEDCKELVKDITNWTK